MGGCIGGQVGGCIGGQMGGCIGGKMSRWEEMDRGIGWVDR